MKQFLVFVLFIGSLCSGYEVTDCGSVSGKFENLLITGCNTHEEKCFLLKNTNVTISFDIILDEDVNNVKANLYGIILDVPFPFPLPNPEVCNDACDLKKGDKFSYMETLSIKKVYPKIALEVKLELKDEKGQNIICMIFPAEIK